MSKNVRIYDDSDVFRQMKVLKLLDEIQIHQYAAYEIHQVNEI
jgi:hypothetical protein